MAEYDRIQKKQESRAIQSSDKTRSMKFEDNKQYAFDLTTIKPSNYIIQRNVFVTDRYQKDTSVTSHDGKNYKKDMQIVQELDGDAPKQTYVHISRNSDSDDEAKIRLEAGTGKWGNDYTKKPVDFLTPRGTEYIRTSTPTNPTGFTYQNNAHLTLEGDFGKYIDRIAGREEKPHDNLNFQVLNKNGDKTTGISALKIINFINNKAYKNIYHLSSDISTCKKKSIRKAQDKTIESVKALMQHIPKDKDGNKVNDPDQLVHYHGKTNNWNE